MGPGIEIEVCIEQRDFKRFYNKNFTFMTFYNKQQHKKLYHLYQVYVQTVYICVLYITKLQHVESCGYVGCCCFFLLCQFVRASMIKIRKKSADLECHADRFNLLDYIKTFRHVHLACA